jgi:hypothetical protein
MNRQKFISVSLSPLFAAAFLILFSSVSTVEVSAQSHPAVRAINLSPLEGEILKEINLARARPSEYAAHLEELRPYFAGRNFRRPGQAGFMTEEGLGALEDAIRYMRSLKPLPPLEVSGGMCLGANAHVTDQGKTGKTGHKGSDGCFCESRLNRFGVWSGEVGENLSYGTETARERVITLIIDDGVADRGHRKRILSPAFKVAGVSCGDHPSMRTLCVLTFAGNFNEKIAGGDGGAADANANAKPSLKRY